MPIGPDKSLFRTAILALLLLGAMLLAAILFESGQAPVEDVVRGWAPLLGIAALPLVVLLILLAIGPSRLAIALALAFPVVVLVIFWLIVRDQMQGDSDSQMNIMFMFMFFWFNIPWMLFLIGFVPVMLRMLWLAWRAFSDIPRRPYGPVVAWIVALFFFGTFGLSATTAAADDVPVWQPGTVDNAIETLNECVWRYKWATAAQAFPDSLPEIGRAPYRIYPRRAGNTSAGRCAEELGRIPLQPFTVEYRRTGSDSSDDGFQLMLVEKVRPGGRPHVVWFDERNLRMEAVRVAVGSSEMDSVRTRSSTALGQLLIIQHWVDGYAQRNDGAYPVSIVQKYSLPEAQRESPPPGILAHREVGSCTTAFPVPERASCFARNDWTFVYLPVDSAGRMSSYTLTVHNPAYDDDTQWQPSPARTYHRDRAGTLHAFGGMRPATDSDPLVTEDEMRFARQALEIHVDQLRRDSIYQASRKP